MALKELPQLDTRTNSYPSTVTVRLQAYKSLLKSRFQRGMVFSAATLVALTLATSMNIQPAHMLTPLITMLSTLAVYLMNDIADIKVDRINAPNRPLASGLVRKSEAFALVAVLSVSSLLLALLVNPLTLIIVGAYLLIGVFYSVPKISLKDRFVIKTLSIAIGGFLTSLIGSSVAGSFDERTLVAAGAFLGLIFMSSPINDLADYAGDKKNGRKTIPIVIGPRNTTMLAVMFPLGIASALWVGYEGWDFNMLTPMVVSAVAITALLVIAPIYKHLEDFKYVRQRHKKIVFLHYGLQLALFIGML